MKDAVVREPNDGGSERFLSLGHLEMKAENRPNNANKGEGSVTKAVALGSGFRR